MTTTEVLCLSATCAAALILLAYYFSVLREVGMARQETSRFPLFNARTKLVDLVEDEIMQENDPAWQSLYEDVNFFLRLDQKMHMIDAIWRYTGVLALGERDASFKEFIAQRRKCQREAADRVPEFRRVMRDVDRSILHLIRRRTLAWHRATLALIVITLRLVYVALFAGVGTARAVRRSLRRPLIANVNAWQFTRTD